MRALFLLIPTALAILSLTAASAARPPMANIANFVVKTDSLDEARRFYQGVRIEPEIDVLIGRIGFTPRTGFARLPAPVLLGDPGAGTVNGKPLCNTERPPSSHPPTM